MTRIRGANRLGTDPPARRAHPKAGDVFLISGHGRVQEGKEQAVRVRELMKSLVEQVAAAAAGGKTLEEVCEAVDLASSRHRLAGDDETARRMFDAWLPELVERPIWKPGRARFGVEMNPRYQM